MHKILVGIEHLMTGVQIMAKDGAVLTFEMDSPSIVRVLCEEPIEAYWPVKQSHIMSTENGPAEPQRHTSGQAEWYAQRVAPALVDMENRSHIDMQTYTRRVGEYVGRDGEPTRYAPGEPSPFPPAVVNAMRTKFGKDADEWLAKLRWAGDHWYFIKDRMYHGVEPDGYIHT